MFTHAPFQLPAGRTPPSYALPAPITASGIVCKLQHPPATVLLQAVLPSAAIDCRRRCAGPGTALLYEALPARRLQSRMRISASLPRTFDSTWKLPVGCEATASTKKGPAEAVGVNSARVRQRLKEAFGGRYDSNSYVFDRIADHLRARRKRTIYLRHPV
jgi:hypothetical protein